MALVVNVTWGDSWRRPKAGLGRVVDAVQDASEATMHDWVEGQPTLDVYIYVSGAVWQHEREGVQLGTLSARGRDSLRVMLYVPDELTSEADGLRYFGEALVAAADRVRRRLETKRPDWPVDRLVTDLLSLIPTETALQKHEV